VAEINLFTDGSVHPQSGIGYGAYLVVTEPELAVEVLKNQVKVQRFENTSSTKLELQILLHALNNIKNVSQNVIIYTDSQNIIRLPFRREYLENNQYQTKKNIRIKNHELYKQFYEITNNLTCELIKVKGHKVSKDKDRIDQIFNLVDKASRSALRLNNKLP